MKLTKNECFVGFKLSLENAKSLIEDAKLLFDKSNYGHSVALSMLAIEECGKALFLFAGHEGIITLDEELWKIIFRDHKTKLSMALYELALFENFPEDEIEYIKSLVPVLDLVKQRGFYVDYLEDPEKWVTPQEGNLKGIARVNLDYAERIYTSVSHYQKLSIQSK